jgi:cellulose synthase/poly-beta-1,6-N-acetylglucosamine synthase-like glycosyltransferase
LIYDTYLRFSGSEDNYLQLNGVGVVKGSLLKRERFDEEAISDDVDFLTRMYLKGKIPVLANTTFGDQVPTSLKDLYIQRVRWYRADVQILSRYLIPMIKASLPFKRKISWLTAVMVHFFYFLSIPVTFLYFADIKKLSNGPLEFIKIFLGRIGFTLFLIVCAIVACMKHLTSRKVEWKTITRSDD